MDYESRINELGFEIQNLSRLHAEIKIDFDNAKKLTSKFLSNCKQHGIKKVSIGTRHESIPASMTFPFGVINSVFSVSKNNTEIWDACRDAGVGGGCGNADQHQLNRIGQSMIDGVYHLKNGTWRRVE
jgi:hypothetical protein